MDVTLVMFKLDGSRRDFPLSKQRLVIGRTSDAGLRIPLSSVSRKHCEVYVEGDKALLRDLGSSNGTFHNSQRVTEAELAAGDRVEVGPVVFTVVIDGEPAQVEPVRSKVEQDLVDTTAGAVVAEPAEGEQVAQEEPPKPPKLSKESQPSVESPTVDLDDPIAALEALADADQGLDELPLLADEEDQKKQDK